MCASEPRSGLLLVTFLIAGVLVGITNSQAEKCEAPNGNSGECISIKLCPYLLDNLYQNVTTELRLYITSSLCVQSTLTPSTEPWVCCDRPICATDDGQAGACVEPAVCRSQTRSSKGTCHLPGRVCCPRRTFDGYVSRMTGLPEFGFCGNVANTLPTSAGRSIPQGLHPWTALLVYRSLDVGSQGRETEKCGGALISARFVLTAAHCIDEMLVKVRLGVRKLSDKCTDVRGGCSFVSSIASVAISPTYNKTSGKNDIAVVTMTSPAPYTDHIRPICLPSAKFDLTTLLRQNAPAVTAGWGVSQELTGNELAGVEDVQGTAELPLRSESVCRGAVKIWAEVLSPFPVDVTIPTNSICAGGTFKGELCTQDSGGALVYNQYGQHMLLGLQSKYIAGCRAPVPAVYTSVLPNVPWIVEQATSYYNIRQSRV